MADGYTIVVEVAREMRAMPMPVQTFPDFRRVLLRCDRGKIFTVHDRISQRADNAGARPENTLQMFSEMSAYRKDLRS
jgi:hypothetical protein